MIMYDSHEHFPIRRVTVSSLPTADYKFSPVIIPINETNKLWKNYKFPYINNTYNAFGSDLMAYQIRHFCNWNLTNTYDFGNVAVAVPFGIDYRSASSYTYHFCSSPAAYENGVIITTQTHLREGYDPDDFGDMPFTALEIVSPHVMTQTSGRNGNNVNIQYLPSGYASKTKITDSRTTDKVKITGNVLYSSNYPLRVLPRILLRNDDDNYFIKYNSISGKYVIPSTTRVLQPTYVKKPIDNSGIRYCMKYQLVLDSESVMCFPDLTLYIENPDGVNVYVHDYTISTEVYK